MNAGQPALDDLLCFALYSASHQMSQKYRELLAPWELTYPQYLALVALWGGEDVTVSELGARLGLDSGTLSPLLKRMEARGMLSRTRSALDERVVTVSLTERGRELRSELADIPACLARETGMTAGEAQEILALVRDLSTRLRENALVDATSR